MVETTTTKVTEMPEKVSEKHGETKYAFRLVSSHHDAFQRNVKDKLTQWGLFDKLRIWRFSFDKPFQAVYDQNTLFHDFFNDKNVRHSFKVLSESGNWISILGDSVTQLDLEKLNASVTSMSFFDRLQNNDVVRDDGSIIQCLDEYTDDNVLICDELRKCLLLDSSDNYTLFSGNDRQEFIFRIFHLLCFGGELCQYEDVIQPYLDHTKLLYKELVSVYKDEKNQGQIYVASNVWQVKNKEFFPFSHMQNVLFFSIDPVKRTVTVLYHAQNNYY